MNRRMEREQQQAEEMARVQKLQALKDDNLDLEQKLADLSSNNEMFKSMLLEKKSK